MTDTPGDHWFVYIVRCNDDSLYTGIAKDVGCRIQEHNSLNNSGAKYTRSRQPVRLVYRESCHSHSSALRRESEIKKLDRRKKEILINDDIKTIHESIGVFEIKKATT